MRILLESGIQKSLIGMIIEPLQFTQNGVCRMKAIIEDAQTQMRELSSTNDLCLLRTTAEARRRRKNSRDWIGKALAKDDLSITEKIRSGLTPVVTLIDLKLALQRDLTHNERPNVVLEPVAHGDENEVELVDPIPDCE